MICFWCIFTSNNKLCRDKEYSSKSELVNGLIRQARKQQAQIDWIRAKLEKAENSGFMNDSKESILLLNDHFPSNPWIL